MPRKLASKTSKLLLHDSEIKDKGLPIGDFSPNWQGRIVFLNVEKSFIAHKMGVEAPGEYALKVR